ncbi:MAG: glycosyltransferase family 2 protein [Thermoanaerobaculia bacterium]
MKTWKHYFHDLLAAEISSMTRYYDGVVQWARVEGDTGYLLSRVEAPRTSCVEGEPPELRDESKRVAVLLQGTFNHHNDVEDLLRRLKAHLARTSRVVVVAFNPYLQWLYRLGVALNMKAGGMPTTFLTITDLDNLCRLSGYQRVRVRPVGYVPWRLLGLGSLVNRLLPAIPLLRHLSLATVIVLRPVIGDAPDRRATVSVVIPARNERGNIEPAVLRLPDVGSDLEVIFVEGHSDDGTWEEIERVRAAFGDRMSIRAYRQVGKGKADAVRLGFEHASGDLLTILDADLTMPPELLPRFVDAYRRGVADFINGSRIVYPMEGAAMRFLNRLGNVFFAKTVSWILGVRLGDCLCGTKLMRRDDYARMVRWRRDFGDFDPFGDFELLFPAATLGLGLVDVPIRYRARTYGSTQINRFRHGLMLLKMTFIGFLRLKLGRIS